MKQPNNLYDVAKQVCHEVGLPWLDPRTGITHDPPKSVKKTAMKKPKQSKTTEKTLPEQIEEQTAAMGRYPGTLAGRVAESVQVLDAWFGKGYAKAHPELLGACIQSIAVDQSGLGDGAMEDNFNNLSGTIEEGFAALAKTFDGIGSAFIGYLQANEIGKKHG